MVEECVITGSRIRRPGLVSSSPLTSVGASQIEQAQEVTIERVIKDLPFSISGDDQNVNVTRLLLSTSDQRPLFRSLGLTLH